MANVIIGICKFCSKEQPELNLFCVTCNKRDWHHNEQNYGNKK